MSNRDLFAILWVIWVERNGRILRNRHTSPSLLWDRAKFLASRWAKATGAFSEVSLTNVQRDN